MLRGVQMMLQLTPCEGAELWAGVICVIDADLALEVVFPTVSVVQRDTFDVCDLKLVNSSCGKRAQ